MSTGVPAARPVGNRRSDLRLRIIAWLVVAGVGGIHAWAGRHDVNPDGVSYLDLAGAFAAGEWRVALNRYWSPLFPALTAIALRLLRPSPYWESATVHLVNFVIYLAALAGFEFFLTQLIRYRRHIEATRASSAGTLPDWALRLAGYTAFAHTSLELGALEVVTPDLCVATIVYLGAGLLLKITMPRGGSLAFPLLGALLGIGYLAKAPMLPIGLIFLGAGAAAIRRHGVRGRTWMTVAAGFSIFALLAGLLGVAFFRTYGRFTLGESARLNYAMFVDGLPYVHWRGEVPGSGTPLHPTRVILASPPLYEFGTPAGGTYPPWFDPAYWYDGVRAHFDAAGEAYALTDSATALLIGVLTPQAALALTLFLLWCRTRSRQFPRNLAQYRIILVPAALSIGLFAPIHLEPRFVVAFVAVLWSSLFAAVPWPTPNGGRGALGAMLAAMLMLLIASTVLNPQTESYRQVRALGREIGGEGDPQVHWTIAEGLRSMGAHRGDRVAVIGRSFDAYWARLLGSRIVAEMPACTGERYHGNTCAPGQPDGIAAFLSADQATKRRILDAFARTGAKVVVISAHDPVRLAGWQRIPGTGYSARLLGN